MNLVPFCNFKAKIFEIEVCDLEILSMILEYRYVQKIITLANVTKKKIIEEYQFWTTTFAKIIFL